MSQSRDNLERRNGEKLRVLIVDDEPTLRLGFSYALSSRNMEVDTAGTGREALEKIAVSDFDILILDQRMPDLDGLGVIEELRGRGNKVPIILCSAALSPSATLRAIRHSVVDFLLKPVRPVDLRDMIRYVTAPPEEPLPAALSAARDGRALEAIRILENEPASAARSGCWHRLLTGIRDADLLGDVSALEDQIRRNLTLLAFNSTATQ